MNGKLKAEEKIHPRKQSEKDGKLTGQEDHNSDLLEFDESVDTRIAQVINNEGLTGRAQQPQQQDSMYWMQEHIGNSVIQDLLEAQQSEDDKGTSLDTELRSAMESAFNYDFTDVRIHIDEEANALSEELNARAFTKGNDIYFRKGEYTTDTPEGKMLLGHELAHIVQQDSLVKDTPSKVTQPGSTAENEAEEAADMMISGEPLHIVPRPELAGTIAREVEAGAPGTTSPATLSQLRSEFSREVLRRIRLAEQFLGAFEPEYGAISGLISAVWDYLATQSISTAWPETMHVDITMLETDALEIANKMREITDGTRPRNEATRTELRTDFSFLYIMALQFWRP